MAPKIVIGGGGFGGLEEVKGLSKVHADVLLLDRQNYHCFQPLHYQLAFAALSPAEVAWPIRSIIRNQRNTTVLMTTVMGVDTDARSVSTDEGRYPFDFRLGRYPFDFRLGRSGLRVDGKQPATIRMPAVERGRVMAAPRDIHG